ncbi:MAG: hypothetical protein JWO49_2217 [Arthrobacter sp.]|nr:hypothetical protein [Arthrobacter sp.]
MIPWHVARICRISLLTVVENTMGCRPVAVWPSMVPTTERACLAVVMNGILMRSKLFTGNCVSNVLPSVSAVMPVLSERK